MDESQEVAQPEAAPVIEESATPEPEKAAGSEENDKPEPKPERTFTQAELDDILTRRLAKEQRKLEKYAKASAEAEMLREQIARMQAPQVQEQRGEPNPDQFKTYEEYLDALTDWKLDKRLQAREQEMTRKQQEQAAREHEESLRTNVTKAADKYDDFEDVVTNPDLNITTTMAHAIGESENGGDIAYYLGTHPKEAYAIAKLSPIKQAQAIAKLEDKLSAAPEVSKAPAPIDPVGKGRTKTDPDLSKMSVKEYAEYRAKNGARWAR